MSVNKPKLNKIQSNLFLNRAENYKYKLQTNMGVLLSVTQYFTRHFSCNIGQLSHFTLFYLYLP